ncbi:hypothetical protein H5410_006579 [Solanum commersonii]|uniref:Uncharacterized protein n=1 Tax=Solanum commersonii TaxID=4109 RepID=A0A9J6AA62_SOLCO|nr:hypothetical protein H5410_006579 [Solanum commersonii]
MNFNFQPFQSFCHYHRLKKMVETTSEGSAAGISADTIDGIEKNRNHSLYLHPSDTSELEKQWEKCNAFMLAWIMNTVSKELLSGIVYTSDAAMRMRY